MERRTGRARNLLARMTQILKIAYSGEYRHGAEGRDDARAMHFAALSGLRFWRPVALVLDMRDLDYVWGDNILAVLDIVDHPETAALGTPLSVIVSDRNEAALISLLGKGFDALLAPDDRQALRIVIGKLSKMASQRR